MWAKNWDDVATTLATYAQREFGSIHRGAFVFRCTDGGLAAAVIGNEAGAYDQRARREVDTIRRSLSAAAVEEVAFGLSPDGFTWVILAKVEDLALQTEIGQRFQIEMMKELLNDVLEVASRISSPVPAA